MLRYTTHAVLFNFLQLSQNAIRYCLSSTGRLTKALPDKNLPVFTVVVLHTSQLWPFPYYCTWESPLPTDMLPPSSGPAIIESTNQPKCWRGKAADVPCHATSVLHGKSTAGIWQLYYVKFIKGQWAYANRLGLLVVCPDLFIKKTFATGNRMDPIQYIVWGWVVFGPEKPQGLLDFIGFG